jgi:hypothetical protein
VPAEPADERRRDGRHDESHEHGLGDLGRCAEEPDEADYERRDADEEPRREAEIAQPARCREDGRERAELSGVDLEDRLLVRIRRRSLFSPAWKDGHAHLGRVRVAGLLVTSWDESGRDRPSHRPEGMTRAAYRDEPCETNDVGAGCDE